MNINPTALVMWTLMGCIGWLLGDTTGAIIGVSAGLFLTLIADIID